MRPLRKAVIVGPAFPLRGGIANFNEALCRSMNAEGIDTTIVSFTLQYPSFLFPGTTQFDSGNPPPDLKIETLINSVNPFSWFAAARRIRQSGPDLVIFRFWLPFMGPCLGTIARMLRKHDIPTIAITDNVIPHEHKPGDKALTGYFIRSVQGFITLSESVRNDLAKFTDTDKKVFLPHPIYNIFGQPVNKADALRSLALPAEGRYILFFGFIRRYKGLDLLLEAMADPKVKATGVKLIVAGEFYEDSKPYTDLIMRSGITDNVIMRTSYIPSDEVKLYFSAADLIVQPYRTATQSGVTQIAYHFGKPMLVTNVGGLPEIVPHLKCGYVTSTSPSDIAAAIHDFYTNRREAEFSLNVQREKGRFEWPVFVKGIRALFSRI